LRTFGSPGSLKGKKSPFSRFFGILRAKRNKLLVINDSVISFGKKNIRELLAPLD
jgi:hypothetical protein